MDVPDFTVDPPDIFALVMLTPGANRSRQDPKLEKTARVSLESVAPTVRAAGADAGDELHALA
jgi:hypothetical protein